MSDTPTTQTPPQAAAPQSQKPDVQFGSPLEEERTLISWKVPARPHKKRSRDFYTTIGAIVFLLSIILAFFKEFLAILAAWSVAFFSYTISRTEPEMTEHAITTRGIRTGEKKYYWGELARFWIEEKWGEKILMVDTFRAFPGRLMMLLGGVPDENVKRVLVKKIPYDKPEATFMDKASKWLSEKVPLEDPRKTAPSTAE